ncbi:MAG: hypothetical protein ABEH91_10600 [Halopenitus sp.]
MSVLIVRLRVDAVTVTVELGPVFVLDVDVLMIGIDTRVEHREPDTLATRIVFRPNFCGVDVVQSICRVIIGRRLDVLRGPSRSGRSASKCGDLEVFVDRPDVFEFSEFIDRDFAGVDLQNDRVRQPELLFYSDSASLLSERERCLLCLSCMVLHQLNRFVRISGCRDVRLRQPNHDRLYSVTRFDCRVDVDLGLDVLRLGRECRLGVIAGSRPHRRRRADCNYRQHHDECLKDRERAFASSTYVW